MNARDVLERACVDGGIVRVHREGLEDGWTDGYVAGCGQHWFALEVFDDASRLNGFSCMRYDDVSECGAAPHAVFRTKALSARKIARAAICPLDLTSLASLIRTAGDAYPLVSLHLSDDEQPYCYIGRILTVTAENVRYRNISPDAVWAAEPSSCALDAINRVDVGGAYEEALFLVAGRN